MNNSAITSLQLILHRFGEEVLDDPKRFEALLRDFLAGNRSEINVLLYSYHQRIPQSILASSDRFSALLAASLVQRLKSDLGMSEAIARWAVQAWAEVLIHKPSHKIIQGNSGTQPRVVIESVQPSRVGSPSPAKSQISIPLNSEVCLHMVRVAEGDFWMGSDPTRARLAAADEIPLHKVLLDTFWMAKFPVTVQQFFIYAQETGVKWECKPDTLKLLHPATFITWHESLAFCTWLRQKTNLPVRLPTEAEWEKAARGSDGREFPWGNTRNPGYANFGLAYPDTTPIGQFSPLGDSPYGCVDMVGNVFEWTGTIFKPYPYSAEDGRESLRGEFPRVLRGGSYNNHLRSARCAFRYKNYPNFRFSNIGFRVAMSQ